MGNLTTQKVRHIKRLAWLIAPLLLLAVAASSFTVIMAHAAPALSPLSGEYKFQGVTTSGPKTGLGISGRIELLVTNTTVNGHLCGLNFTNNSSHCAIITGTTDGTNVNLTINSFVQFPTLHATGKYVTNLIHKGASGFTGTYTAGASSGTWTAVSMTTPSIAGSWNFYAIVQQGKDKGHQIHADITLGPGANDSYTGTFCMKSQPCVALHGQYLYSYIRLYINETPVMVLRGTYTFAGTHIASGQFYMQDTSGDKGYWLMH